MLNRATGSVQAPPTMLKPGMTIVRKPRRQPPTPSGGGEASPPSPLRPPSPPARYFSPGDITVNSPHPPNNHSHSRNPSITESRSSKSSYTFGDPRRDSANTAAEQHRERLSDGLSGLAGSHLPTAVQSNQCAIAFPPVMLHEQYVLNMPTGQDVERAGSRRVLTRRVPPKSDLATAFAASRML